MSRKILLNQVYARDENGNRIPIPAVKGQTGYYDDTQMKDRLDTIQTETANIEQAMDGTIIETVVNAERAYSKQVPQNALMYAAINSLGGATTVNNGTLINHSPTAVVGADTLDVSTLVQKYFPDGMKSAGDVYDELDFEHGVAIKRVGTVDLGTISWSASDYRYTSRGITSVIKLQVPSNVVANAVCSKYTVTSNDDSTRRITGIAVGKSGTLYIYDSECNPSDVTAAQFKQMLSGVMLNYELANYEIRQMDEHISTAVRVVAGDDITVQNDNGDSAAMPSTVVFSVKKAGGGSGGVTDVLLGSASIVENGVASIKVSSGLTYNHTGIYIANPTQAYIDSRTSNRAITCSVLNPAVTAALTDVKHITLTADQQKTAKEVLGISQGDNGTLVVPYQTQDQDLIHKLYKSIEEKTAAVIVEEDEAWDGSLYEKYYIQVLGQCWASQDGTKYLESEYERMDNDGNRDVVYVSINVDSDDAVTSISWYKYVKSLPTATDGKAGLTKYATPIHIMVRSGGLPVLSTQVDLIVKSAMCDGHGAAWTQQQQLAAQQRMGIEGWHTVTATEADFVVDGNYKKYKIIPPEGYRVAELDYMLQAARDEVGTAQAPLVIGMHDVTSDSGYFSVNANVAATNCSFVCGGRLSCIDDYTTVYTGVFTQSAATLDSLPANTNSASAVNKVLFCNTRPSRNITFNISTKFQLDRAYLVAKYHLEKAE